MSPLRSGLQNHLFLFFGLPIPYQIASPPHRLTRFVERDDWGGWNTSCHLPWACELVQLCLRPRLCNARGASDSESRIDHHFSFFFSLPAICSSCLRRLLLPPSAPAVCGHTSATESRTALCMAVRYARRTLSRAGECSWGPQRPDVPTWWKPVNFWRAAARG